MTVNEKIAKWCGFKTFEPPCKCSECASKNLIDPKTLYTCRAPDFQNDFSPCLKWAVPKLDYMDIAYNKGKFYVELRTGLYDSDIVMAENESLPEAFTDALIKVIDSEEKKCGIA